MSETIANAESEGAAGAERKAVPPPAASPPDRMPVGKEAARTHEGGRPSLTDLSQVLPNGSVQNSVDIRTLLSKEGVALTTAMHNQNIENLKIYFGGACGLILTLFFGLALIVSDSGDRVPLIHEVVPLLQLVLGAIGGAGIATAFGSRRARAAERQ